MFDTLCEELQTEVMQWSGLAELLALQCCSRSIRARSSAAELWARFRPDRAGRLRWFTAACRAGGLERVQWLTRTFGIAESDVSTKLPQLFGAACECGHLDVAQWLQAHWRADRSVATTMRALVRMSYAGHLALLRWLATLDPVFWQPGRAPLHREMLKAACATGRLGVAQWLVACCASPAEAAYWQPIAALAESCLHGRLGAAKWVVAHFRLTPAQVRAELEADGVADQAELFGHVAVVAWLNQWRV
jgi:hypothetical protein